MPFCSCPSPSESSSSLVGTKTSTNHKPEQEWTEFKTDFFEFHNPQQLIASSSAGTCVASSVVVNGLDAIQEGWADEATFITVKKPPGRPHEIFVTGGSLYLNVRLFVPHDVPPIPGFCKLQSDVLVDDTVVDPSYKLVRSWLDRCLKEHSSTCGRPLPKLMPKRLIDTARKTPTNNDVRIEETNGKPRNYIALSHCWGQQEQKQPAKLCKRTIASTKKRIAWSTLPQNFQDAITFTRELGIRWLWIDSLCIVQDDAADKQREIPKMANIYEGAHLTIVAANASNSHESFLRPRRSGIPIPNTPGVWVRNNHLHENLEAAPPSLPLFSRGWPYQERLLSTRMITFGAEELYWECKSDQLCECGDGKMQVRPLKRRWQPSASFDRQSIERHDYWHEIVAEYTNRKLRWCEDKLPALSGIASRSTCHLSDVYLAGLWKDRMIRDLCWQQNDDSERTLPLVYRAPTWSWASIEARIINQFGRGCDEDFRALPSPIMRIDEAVCSPLVEDNPYGAVRDGYLIVTAPTITVKIESECKPPVKGTENGFSVVIDGSPGSNYFWPDVHLIYSSSGVADNTIFRCEEEVRPAWKNLDVPLRCVLIVQGESKIEGVNMKTSSKCIWALVLGKARSQEGAYERLGILTSFRKSGTEVWGNGYKWFDGAAIETTKII